MGTLELLDAPVHQDLLEAWGLQEDLVSQDRKVSQDETASQVDLDPREMLVFLELLGQVFPEKWDFQVPKEIADSQAFQGHQDQQA